MQKNTLCKLLTLMLIFCITFSLCSCKPEEAKTSREIYALDTVINLTAYGKNREKAIDAAISEIKRLESLFSVTAENSDIWKINHSDGNPVVVSDDTARLLEKAISSHSITTGNFDITLHNTVKLWGFTSDKHRVPEQKEIDEALKTTGIEKLTIKGNTVTLSGGASIDLGGIAKGYIGDRTAEIMKNAGCECALISLGGNIRTVGKKTSDEPFVIGIEHPEKGGYFATVETGECSVITSGAYQRNFIFEGKFYHHIIDPENGYPADSEFSSVTVIGKDGALCDALSTAIFIGGTDYAKDIYNSQNDISLVLLTKDNELLITQDLKEKLCLEQEYNDIKISYFP